MASAGSKPTVFVLSLWPKLTFIHSDLNDDLGPSFLLPHATEKGGEKEKCRGNNKGYATKYKQDHKEVSGPAACQR